jgi:hypothetical protein
MRQQFYLAAAVAALWCAAAGRVQALDVQVTGGTTSVFLDPAVLELINTRIVGVSAEVISPGSLPDSVAFPINPRNAAAPALPTTFAYNTDDFLMTFTGSLEHSGSIFFAMDDTLTQTGNFTIGYDAARTGAGKSGFFVRSNIGLEGILFDVATPSLLDPRADGLTVQAPLLVSPELAGVLGNAQLAGAPIGEARVEAVPEPASLIGLLLGGFLLLNRRRRPA